MCLSRKEEVALELQASPEMDPPTLPECRLLVPKIRTQNPRSVTWLGCVPAGVGAEPGTPMLDP